MNRKLAILVLVVGIAAAGTGYLLGSFRASARAATPGVAAAAAPVQQAYTCSMHPQVRLDRPGQCPICEMPLIPADAAQAGADGEPVLPLSDRALAMAGVETSPVTRRELSRRLRAVGKVQYNESSLATVTARVDGYAERLFVSFAGVEIRAGDHLAEVYSPDLLVAQRELLIALQSGTGSQTGPLVEMSKLKLRRWGLTAEQIEALVKNREIAERITLYSPIQGTVIEKSVVQNSAFKAGDVLYRVANLDTVWVYLDVYEYDLAWVRYGQRVEIRAEALPGREFTGLVTFVQPLVDEETRTVRVPVHVENPDHALTPGMFVSAEIVSTLTGDGQAGPTGAEGKFSCPMHPQVLLGDGGDCPVCDMPLERIPGAPPAAPAAAAKGSDAGVAGPDRFACPMECEDDKTYAQAGNCPVCHMKLTPAGATPAAAGAGLLAVPASAILDSGTRRLVYVAQGHGLFAPREVVLGPRAGDLVPVLKGLTEGERVVTRGGFLIDSQFQITGQPSLFYPGGLLGDRAAQPQGAAPVPAPPPPEPSATDTGPHRH